MLGQKQIFRKVALERLASPEQLDLLMQVTTPKGWLALIALSSLLITAIFWGIYGSIPTKVLGQGILIQQGGVFDVVSLGTGQLTEITVKAGDFIQKDQIVARIAQPDVVEQIENTQAELNYLRSQNQQLSSFDVKDLKLQTDYLAQQRANLNQSIKVLEESLKWLKDKIETQEQLLKKGLITKQTLLTTKQNFDSTQGELEKTRNELKQLSVKELSLKHQKQQESSSRQQKIDQLERKLKELENELEVTSRVISPYSGRILEIKERVGNVVPKATPILSLEFVESDNQNLEAILYLPATDGKKIQPGMEVQITPSTVKAEEFGVMLGKVKSVADFPSTYQGMMRVLANEQLVRTLSEGGAPIAVDVELLRDLTTPSGYKWSSAEGPPIRISSGTLCSGALTIRTQRPINLVIPLLKEKLGI